MTDTTDNNIEMIDTKFKDLFTQLNTFSKQARLIQDDLKNLQRSCKQAERQAKLRKRKPQEKLNISNELANFLKIDSSTQLSKDEVMKQVSNYIKENSLQTPEDKRRFKPNKQLSKIFGVSNVKTGITFVEINKLVSHHMSK